MTEVFSHTTFVEQPGHMQYEADSPSYDLPFRTETVTSVGNLAIREASEIPIIDLSQEQALQLTSLEREPVVGRQGPEYTNKGETHTDQELLARWHDWARGCGRMLDIAWDEGLITPDSLSRWIELKAQVAYAKKLGDPYALIDFVVPLRMDVFAFTKAVGASGKAVPAYFETTD